MACSHYTVGYRDERSRKCVICAYAKDSYEARQVVMETVRYVHEHPNCIDHILAA